MRGGESTSRTKWLTGIAAVVVGASLGWSLADLVADLGSVREPPIDVVPRQNRPPEHVPLPEVLRNPPCPHPVHEGEPRLRLVEVVQGLTLPVHIASIDGDHRLFVLESRGRIRIVENGELRPRPFLAFPEGRSRSEAAHRFGALAFHPRHHVNGRLFLSHIDVERKLARVVEVQVGDDPNRADLDSLFPLLEIPLPTLDQEPPLLAFGPDGYLYVALGDGGIPRDPHLYAQRTDSHLGKVLRLDVDRTSAYGPYALPEGNLKGPRILGEIWAVGLHRPSGLAFDRRANELWLADRGELYFDEIDVVHPSESGLNLGWSFVEGSFCLGRVPCDSEGLTPPVFEMARRDRCNLVGGRVYRGCRMPALQGEYVFGDGCGHIRSLRVQGRDVELKERIVPAATIGIRALGEDATGELYVVSSEGSLYRIDPD